MSSETLNAALQQLLQPVHREAHEETSDQQLLAHFRRHQDQGAFSELVKRHGPLVLGVCKRILQHTQDAEDAFQATFFVLARKAGTLGHIHSLANWLHAVAHNIALNSRISAQRRRNREKQDMVNSSEEPLAALGRAEIKEVLDEELGKLPWKYRAPLVLCCLQEKSHESAARELGWPSGSISKRLARGRELLARRLARRGLAVTSLTLTAALGETANASVPPALIQSTSEGALQFGAGNELASLPAGALARRALKSMALARWKLATACVVCFGFLCVGAGYLGGLFAAPDGQAAPAAAKDQEDPGKQPGGPLAIRQEPDAPLPDGVVARLGSARFRHGGATTAVALSPDDKLVASADTSNVIHIWDAATGVERQRIQVPNKVQRLGFSAGGKLLAAGQLMYIEGDEPEAKALVELFDVESGKRTRKLPDCTLLGFMAQGKQLVLGKYGRAQLCRGIDMDWLRCDGWQVLDPATGKGSAECAGELLAFDARRPVGVVCSSALDAVELVDLTTGNSLSKPLSIKEQVGNAACFAPDGRTVAVAGLRKVYLIETRTFQMRGKVQLPLDIASVQFSGDGKHLVVACVDDRLRVFEVGSGEYRLTLDALPQVVGNYMEWQRNRPTGTNAGIGGIGGINGLVGGLPPPTTYLNARSIRSGGIYGLAGGNFVGNPANFQPPAGAGRNTPPRPVMAMSRDGKRLVLGSQLPYLRFWNVHTGQEEQAPVGHQQAVRALAFSADGKLLASGSTDRTIGLWDTAQGKLRRVLAGHSGTVDVLVFLDEGKRLISGSSEEAELFLWDTVSGQRTRLDLPGNSGKNANATPAPGTARQTTLCSGGHSVAIRTDTRQHNEEQEQEKGTAQICVLKLPEATSARSLEFADDLQLNSGLMVMPVIALSADSRRLAASLAGGIGMWDLESGKRITVLPTPASIPSRLTFSADGKLLALVHVPPDQIGDGYTGKAAQIREVVTIWELTSGKELHRLEGHHGQINDLAFTKDSTSVATCDDYEIRLWDLSTGRQRQAVAVPAGPIQSLQFSPDGRYLASGAGDATVLIWEVQALLQTASKGRLRPEELTSLWNDLGNSDSELSWQALQRLSTCPQQVVPFLNESMKPTPELPEAQFNQLSADLAGNDAAQRQKAAQAFVKLGLVAVPRLRQLLAAGPDLEQRRRIEQILEKIAARPHAEELRNLRAIEVLERVNTADARAILKRMAGGAADVDTTREAQAALVRLGQR